MNQKIKKTVIVILVLVGFGSCATVGKVIFFFAEDSIIVNSGRDLAFALVPSTYPNSKLVDKYGSCASAVCYQEQTYRAQDNLDQVLVFMELQMPGFEKWNDSKLGLVYSNHKEDKSEKAERAAKYACASLFCTTYNAWIYPSVGISLYADSVNPDETIIKIRIDWPVP